MIKKTITDFNDNVQTGDFYFNLTAIQESGDKKALVELFNNRKFVGLDPINVQMDK